MKKEKNISEKVSFPGSGQKFRLGHIYTMWGSYSTDGYTNSLGHLFDCSSKAERYTNENHGPYGSVKKVKGCFCQDDSGEVTFWIKGDYRKSFNAYSAKKEVEKKARSLGLTEEEINLLKG